MKGEIIMKDWVDFTIEDVTWKEIKVYTLESFEEMCGDKVIAVELDKINKPKYIWTERYCFIILRFQTLMGQLGMISMPRNPK
jgi:hypothetical protein